MLLVLATVSACSSSDSNPATEPPADQDSGTGGSSGAGGAAGAAGANTGGAAGAACAVDCGPVEQCFDGVFCVAKTVTMPAGFGIDATEVTRAQYEAWLNTNPSTSGQPSMCWKKSDFVPETSGEDFGCTNAIWPPGANGDLPVVCVDWCDANAYCAGVGKRLCGKIGGGGNDYGDDANAAASQWFAACSSGGQNGFTYGNTLQPQTCNGADNTLSGGSNGRVLPVASLDGCHAPAGGYAGVYDMSGNAAEWEDSCEPSGASYSCRVRGGSFLSYSTDTRCDAGMGSTVNARSRDTGFRCCTP